nr:hypothetical protein [Tanacetum cinerariifolium]
MNNPRLIKEATLGTNKSLRNLPNDPKSGDGGASAEGEPVSSASKFDSIIIEGTVNDSDSEEIENVFVKDNGKPMDGLVDDARKKVEAPPNKTPRKNDIWSGKKADYSKRNVAFTPVTKVHYFDRKDTEEVEHENSYSKKS